MISALRTQRNRALVSCDGCAAQHVETVDILARGRVNAGQVAAKLNAQGWRIAGRKHLCPGCVARQRAQDWQPQEGMMAKNAPAAAAARSACRAESPPRQPTREQKREIVQLLDASYDVKAGRYVGGETDQTVAASLPGILPGWVASVREDLYGPAGGNEEIEGLLAELRRELAAMAARDAAIEATRAELAEAKDALAGFLKRLEAIRTAVGPKAAHA